MTTIFDSGGKMKPYLVSITNAETNQTLIVDMEGPYHCEKERIGEHIYGITIFIDGIPYHFEKYIPTEEELIAFQNENDDPPVFFEGKFLYRIVPFTK